LNWVNLITESELEILGQMFCWKIY